jgi:hypothetical protein
VKVPKTVLFDVPYISDLRKYDVIFKKFGVVGESAMRAVIWLVAACLSAGAAHAKQDLVVMFWKPNADTCAKILPLEAVQKQFRATDEDARKMREYGVLAGWIQGYVTATNAYHPKSKGNFAPTLNAGDVMNWLFSFCRSDPGADFYAIFNALNKNVLKLQP